MGMREYLNDVLGPPSSQNLVANLRAVPTGRSYMYLLKNQIESCYLLQPWTHNIIQIVTTKICTFCFINIQLIFHIIDRPCSNKKPLDYRVRVN